MPVDPVAVVITWKALQDSDVSVHLARLELGVVLVCNNKRTWMDNCCIYRWHKEPAITHFYSTIKQRIFI